MRLLKREKSGWLLNTYTFSLISFAPRDIPSEYAILSHRWGLDEVTYKDIENGSAKARAGYKKLEFCAEQASCDGLLYFWVDTCCIDKSNSVELSEAINSMFKWYQKATKCYVYLPDLSLDRSAGDTIFQDDLALALRNSDWFTRGWTLQELIAPTAVEFFSVEGRKLGNKTSLEQQLCEITGIPLEVLRGKPLSEIDEQERLSWAARRQTTVEEDAAYCLFGIFDVQMPLIYGEGQQKAMNRLLREVQQFSKSSSHVMTDAPWIVPFERNPYFIGRESLISEIEKKCFTGNQTSRVAISGLGGVGKTQLVLELLYRTRQKRKNCSVLWIPAMTIEALQQGYVNIAQKLQISGCDEKGADIRNSVQDHLSREDSGPWLLVFDNADDISLWTTLPTTKCNTATETDSSVQAGSRRLIDYLPKNKLGCIIFTTRDRKAAVKFAQQNIYNVPELSSEMATNLLTSLLANSRLADSAEDVQRLLGALTCLPLAITQATAYINANEITLAEYTLLLEEQEEDVIDILSEDFEDFGRYQDLKNPVATTWSISFEQIRRSDSLAADYLSFIACINPTDIPEWILPPGPSRKRELEALGTLSAYSFIIRRPLDSSLDLHRLVHLATRNWLRNEGSLIRWTGSTIQRLTEIFPDSQDQNRALWRTLLPHVGQVLASDLVHEDVEHGWALMRRYGKCLYEEGRWNEAEAMFLKSMKMTEAGAEFQSLSNLSSIHWLAVTYLRQGRWHEAEQLQTRMMETSQTDFGYDHPYTLSCMNHLAVTYSYQGRWLEAEPLQVQVIEIQKAKLGPDHSDTLVSTGNLAQTYSRYGRWKEAEQLQVQLLKILKTRLGPDHLESLKTVHNLGLTYFRQGQWQEAEQLQKEVLERCKTKLGPDHPDTLAVMDDLAGIWKELGRGASALTLLRECAERQARVLGAAHRYTLWSKETLEAWEAEEPCTSMEASGIDDAT